ncbi:VOC family protein [Halomarina salina]|uniref:VOC family protein n=1 Tax=Halomarina salina TaxID=1872699 RepID=A0ABD5RQD9_9EURY|nr:VOC family protein [Halomarina salina]
MEPHISIVTLGVSDLDRSVRFYDEGLGLPLRERDPDSNVAFFELAGAWLSLYPRDLLAEDATVPADGSGFAGVTIAHNVATREGVDDVLAQAEAAGGDLVKSGEEVFWGGYSGYFADPDGHLWEVAWNPDFDLD